MAGSSVYVAGTFDTKGTELNFVADRIRAHGLDVTRIDLSTGGTAGEVEIPPATVAASHPGGAEAVFTDDRGSAVSAMALAFAHYIATRDDVAGLIGLGGSGGTALVAPAMRELPVGTPKLMVSTVASGNVAAYVGPTDITMMHSVTDVAGLNRISRVVMTNAANAMAGMARGRAEAAVEADDKPAVGLTMFGVTTPCVNQLVAALAADYDCLVFHATGIGGQSMEKLVDSGLISGVLDVTTTEVCDLLFGGVLAATEDRFGAIARTRVPYVGSCGALDMVNFGSLDSVPERHRGRNLYVHNPQVTLMRTTAAENAEMGRWIGNKLNQCEGEVRFLIPEGGVSLLDAPDMPFHDPEADAALFAALEATVEQTPQRQLIRVPAGVNEPAFVQALLANFKSIVGEH
ncbi:hypothetical protein BA190_18805 [Labrys sp. WJW]|uniref:Tm-1-like ATP-binding domain-containing protein n=1 Tax=Labrys sp. WJW TaxID=1737983 RepID=UPI000829D233|nr:Tm-1-like ATP-binding domain-containing protein [Labrys sp. WJW]OCC03393.1 hypothetical protein BA190_18805 [Labrys sp. WJW]